MRSQYIASLTTAVLIFLLAGSNAYSADNIDSWMQLTDKDFCEKVKQKDSASGAEAVEKERVGLAAQGQTYRQALQTELTDLANDIEALKTKKANRETEIKKEHDSKIKQLEEQKTAAQTAYDNKKTELDDARRKLAYFGESGLVAKVKNAAKVLIDHDTAVGALTFDDISKREGDKLRDKTQKAMNEFNSALVELRNEGLLSVPNTNGIKFYQSARTSWDTVYRDYDIPMVIKQLTRQRLPAVNEVRDLENHSDIKTFTDLTTKLSAARTARTNALADDKQLKDIATAIYDIGVKKKPPLRREIGKIDARLAVLNQAKAGLAECIHTKKLEIESRKLQFLIEKMRLAKEINKEWRKAEKEVKEKMKKAYNDVKRKTDYGRCPLISKYLSSKFKAIESNKSVINRLGKGGAGPRLKANARERSRIRARWNASGCTLPSGSAARKHELEKRKKAALKKVEEEYHPIREELRALRSANRIKVSGMLNQEVYQPLRNELPATASNYSNIDRKIDNYSGRVLRVIQKLGAAPTSTPVLGTTVTGFLAWSNPNFGNEEDPACLDLAEAMTTRLDEIDRELVTDARKIKQAIADDRLETAGRECESLREKAQNYKTSDPKDPVISTEIGKDSERFERLYGTNQGWKDERRVNDQVFNDIQEMMDREALALRDKVQEMENAGCTAIAFQMVTSEVEDKVRKLNQEPTSEDLKLPNIEITCELEQSADDNTKLGRKWIIREKNWAGIWWVFLTRRGKSNLFTAKWDQIGNDKRIRAVMQIDIRGDQVKIIRRKSSDGNDCTYTGTLKPDGVNVRGTYTCTKHPGPYSWRGKITGLVRPSAEGKKR